MIVSGKLNIFILLPFFLLLAGSCGDSSTDPQDIPNNSRILSSLLGVSIIPGGTETIKITATDQNGLPDLFEVSSDNPGVAAVTKSDSLIEVTGVAYGTAVITVVGGSGRIKSIPVQVYNHYVLDAGELLISFVDTYQYRWRDQGSGGAYDGSFYHPITENDFRALGSLGFPGYSSPDGNYAMMVVKETTGSDALAEPLDYSLLWFYRVGFMFYDTVATFWIPIPPEGYKAMGLVAQAGPEKPDLSDVVCVREDLTVPGRAGSFIWSDNDTSMPWDFGSWKIYPPEAGPHSMAYLETGTFVGWNYWHQPESHQVMNVLKLELPMLIEAPDQFYIPQLTGLDTPPEETAPLMAKSMLAPCTIVRDLIYGDNVGWRVANSPFYRLERHVFYKLLYHNYNQTSEIQTNNVTIRSGITTSESETFWESTSVSVTAEAGVSFNFFSGSISATVSTSFGYETQTSISELEETEVSSSINTPPGKAAALWQKYNRFVLKRHNGITLEPVAAWEFGIDSYTTDEYPDE
ncbi:MAG: Vps62-related protein [candidate division Zixibacteria bacterium]